MGDKSQLKLKNILIFLVRFKIRNTHSQYGLAIFNLIYKKIYITNVTYSRK